MEKGVITSLSLLGDREDKYPASNAATLDNVSSRSHYARLQVVLISQKVVLG